MSKRTILGLVANKLKNIKSVGVTSYDYPTSRIINKTNVDFIVVGDTAGSTIHGVKNLNKVCMNTMLKHCESVVRGCDSKFIIGDMPFMSYQQSNELAVCNAGKFIQTGVDAVKVEGFFPDRVKSITDSGILVMSHLGLTPQTYARMGGYRIQAKTGDEVDKLVKQSKIIERSGASLLLLEAVPKEVSRIVSSELDIPVYGIGAGPYTDGQLTIFHDLVGLFWDFKPKFVKQYINTEKIFTDVLQDYTDDVKSSNFPSDEHCYSIKPQELEKFLGMGGNSWKYT